MRERWRNAKEYFSPESRALRREESKLKAHEKREHERRREEESLLKKMEKREGKINKLETEHTRAKSKDKADKIEGRIIESTLKQKMCPEARRVYNQRNINIDDTIALLRVLRYELAPTRDITLTSPLQTIPLKVIQHLATNLKKNLEVQGDADPQSIIVMNLLLDIYRSTDMSRQDNFRKICYGDEKLQNAMARALDEHIFQKYKFKPAYFKHLEYTPGRKDIQRLQVTFPRSRMKGKDAQTFVSNKDVLAEHACDRIAGFDGIIKEDVVKKFPHVSPNALGWGAHPPLTEEKAFLLLKFLDDLADGGAARLPGYTVGSSDINVPNITNVFRYVYDVANWGRINTNGLIEAAKKVQASPDEESVKIYAKEGIGNDCGNRRYRDDLMRRIVNIDRFALDNNIIAAPLPLPPGAAPAAGAAPPPPPLGAAHAVVGLGMHPLAAAAGAGGATPPASPPPSPHHGAAPAGAGTPPASPWWAASRPVSPSHVSLRDDDDEKRPQSEYGRGSEEMFPPQMSPRHKPRHKMPTGDKSGMGGVDPYYPGADSKAAGAGLPLGGRDPYSPYPGGVSAAAAGLEIHPHLSPATRAARREGAAAAGGVPVPPPLSAAAASAAYDENGASAFARRQHRRRRRAAVSLFPGRRRRSQSGFGRVPSESLSEDEKRRESYSDDSDSPSVSLGSIGGGGATAPLPHGVSQAQVEEATQALQYYRQSIRPGFVPGDKAARRRRGASLSLSSLNGGGTGSSGDGRETSVSGSSDDERNLQRHIVQQGGSDGSRTPRRSSSSDVAPAMRPNQVIVGAESGLSHQLQEALKNEDGHSLTSEEIEQIKKRSGTQGDVLRAALDWQEIVRTRRNASFSSADGGSVGAAATGHDSGDNAFGKAAGRAGRRLKQARRRVAAVQQQAISTGAGMMHGGESRHRRSSTEGSSFDEEVFWRGKGGRPRGMSNFSLDSRGGFSPSLLEDDVKSPSTAGSSRRGSPSLTEAGPEAVAVLNDLVAEEVRLQQELKEAEERARIAEVVAESERSEAEKRRNSISSDRASGSPVSGSPAGGRSRANTEEEVNIIVDPFVESARKAREEAEKAKREEQKAQQEVARLKAALAAAQEQRNSLKAPAGHGRNHSSSSSVADLGGDGIQGDNLRGLGGSRSRSGSSLDDVEVEVGSDLEDTAQPPLSRAASTAPTEPRPSVPNTPIGPDKESTSIVGHSIAVSGVAPVQAAALLPAGALTPKHGSPEAAAARQGAQSEVQIGPNSTLARNGNKRPSKLAPTQHMAAAAARPTITSPRGSQPGSARDEVRTPKGGGIGDAAIAGSEAPSPATAAAVSSSRRTTQHPPHLPPRAKTPPSKWRPNDTLGKNHPVFRSGWRGGGIIGVSKSKGPGH